MTGNPVESNFVTRFILGLAVILAMMVAGGLAATAFGTTGVRYAEPVGMFVGALATFVAFGVWYTRYDASWTETSREP